MLNFLLLLLTLTLFPFSAQAKTQETLDISAFSSLPILHEGRVKPLDSFARIMLKRFSGQEKIGDYSASQWLAESIFDPASAVEKPLFKIFDAHKYDLRENKNKLYSYIDLSEIIKDKEKAIRSLLETPENTWSTDQQTLIELYNNFILYTQILRSLTLFLPLDTGDQKNSFVNHRKRQKDIDKTVKAIVQQKGTNLEEYTAEEKKLAVLSYQLRLLEEGGKNNVLLRVIPEDFSAYKTTEWHSPWAFVQQGKNLNGLKYADIWKKLVTAYRTDNANLWTQSLKEAQDYFPAKKWEIEVLYNQLHLLTIAQILYVLSFAGIVLGSFFPHQKWGKTSYLFLLSGVIAHSFHLGLRTYILERPPVGTLYESILFVSLVAVAGFAYLTYKQKTTTGTLLGSLSGIILLVTAQGFASEDTMSTLVAVLNTNFWLATHVLTISIGYGVCLITSLIAHYYLIQKILNPEKTDLFSALIKNLKTLLLLSLLFTTIGTILGGIWADQSWGRFWGWDPKENGALLIVLWLAWLLHGRIGQHINDNGFVIGSAFLSVIVVLAWFGVNLLNVGLHSYGFIAGVAMGIGLFCAFETLLVGGLWYLGKNRKTVL